MKKALKGVMPPIVTPFKDEDLDLKALAFNIERWNKTGLSGYVVLGSNGEGVFLSDEERLKVLVRAREAAAPDKLFIVGAGGESTTQAIKRVNQAAELGADAALVLPPHYYKRQMKPEVLIDHFLKLAEAAKAPLLIYNMPANTGLNLGPEIVARLAEHPNIVGLKDSSGNVTQLSEMIRLTPPHFAVLQGSSSAYYAGLCLGAKGAILAVANVLPGACLEIFNCVERGDHRRAAELSREMTPLALMTTATYGVGCLKMAMDMMGFQGGQVRAPLKAPPQTEVGAELKRILKFFEPFEG